MSKNVKRANSQKNKERKKRMKTKRKLTAGLEPTISCSVGRCLIQLGHASLILFLLLFPYFRDPSFSFIQNSFYFVILYMKKNLNYFLVGIFYCHFSLLRKTTWNNWKKLIRWKKQSPPQEILTRDAIIANVLLQAPSSCVTSANDGSATAVM